MRVRIYVEGGGSSKTLRTACRRGFRSFIENAGISCRQNGIQPVACGPRHDAYDSFRTAHSAGDSHPMLLVDAEAPVATADAWSHVGSMDGWARPDGAADDQCHLMVQVMESWFLADKAALASFYGQGFRERALSGRRQVEGVPKTEVLSGLEQATRSTGKGAYSKGSHSFDILSGINPEAVETVAPYAKRFLDTLRAVNPA